MQKQIEERRQLIDKQHQEELDASQKPIRELEDKQAQEEAEKQAQKDQAQK